MDLRLILKEARVDLGKKRKWRHGGFRCDVMRCRRGAERGGRGRGRQRRDGRGMRSGGGLSWKIGV
ncbi:MAG TPA: hypothetical protein PKD61_18435, partial [Polyangiaceae bacterium]|nr:hypothetical protein [Polyangiaceae bacterium]